MPALRVANSPDTEDVVELAKQVLEDAQAQKSGDKGADERLQASVLKLQRVAEGPAVFSHRVRYQPLQNICLLMAHEMKLLHILVENDGQPVTAKELAEMTNYNELLIIRILRLLAAAGICSEADVNTYKTNMFTAQFASKGLEGGTKHIMELLGGIAAKLVYFMRDTGFTMFPDDAKGEESVFKYAWDIDVWQKLREDPEHRRAFDDLMAGRRKGMKSPWCVTYPAAEKLEKAGGLSGETVLLVDVGGNQGHELNIFREHNPNIPGRLILQDLQETLATVDKSCLHESIELMEYDFFTEQPIKGARIYYLRNIVHDWSNADSIKILSNIAKAMERGYSWLLIDDWVLPAMDAPLRGVSADILMMMLTTGMERTRPQWDDLLDQCGLQIEEVWSPAEGGESILKAVLKD